MKKDFPKIVITPGEPAGIGPDIVVQCLAEKKIPSSAVIIADKNVLKARAEQLHLPFNTEQIQHVPVHAPVVPGELNPKNSSYVIETLTQAIQGCLNGKLDQLVTGPVHKAVINDAGIPFKGHTEFLAKLSGVKKTVMMLANDQMRVALLTTHIPLKEVANHITAENLIETIKIIDSDFKAKWNISPRILVCGLNPHAGEGGHIGTEEKDIMVPTLKKLQQEGIKVMGPVSADTAFTPTSLKQAHVVLAMYHDQGLPAIKQSGFGETVNITLGLPFLRTSVDHGTALPLAGTGRASPQSFLKALHYGTAVLPGSS